MCDQIDKINTDDAHDKTKTGLIPMMDANIQDGIDADDVHEHPSRSSTLPMYWINAYLVDEIQTLGHGYEQVHAWFHIWISLDYSKHPASGTPAQRFPITRSIVSKQKPEFKF